MLQFQRGNWRRGLTRGRTRRGPASARRPSRLVRRYLSGVTPPASRASNAGKRRAATASARGPWPRGLTSGPLGRHRSPQLHASPSHPGVVTRMSASQLTEHSSGNPYHWRFRPSNRLLFKPTRLEVSRHMRNAFRAPAMAKCARACARYGRWWR